MAASVSPRFTWALARLPVRSDDRVLEIGCGHGIALGLVAERLRRGHILGLDRSATMTRLARARNAAAVRDGRVSVRTGALASADLGPDPFDLVFAINVSLFAGHASEELTRLGGLLKSRASIFAFYESPAAAHAARFARGATRAFERHGFSVNVETSPPRGVLVIAR